MISIEEEGYVARISRYTLGASPVAAFASMGHIVLAIGTAAVVFAYGALEYHLGAIAQEKKARRLLIQTMMENGYTDKEIVDLVKHGRVGVIEVRVKK